VYLQYLVERDIDTKYMAQMQMQMLICDRKWCDYVCYNPNFEKSIVIARVIPSIEEFAKLEKGFEIARARIDEISKTISEGASNV
jgi:exodeoxyribonuclease (lambda-induced)